MTKNAKVLFLTLHTFSLTGGIEKVCCSLAKALTDLDFSFNLYAMHDEDKDIDNRYIKALNYKGFKHKKINFGITSVLKGINADIVILSHTNLLLFAFIIKKLSPKTKIIMYAHGIELWREIPNWKKKFLQKSVEIWAVSKYTSNTLTTLHQISPEKIKIVNNCLDPFFKLPNDFEKPTALLSRHHLNATQPILFTLTRLSSQETYKGYDRVLLAMPTLLKKFPNLHYVLAGKADETESQRVLALIEQLNLKSHVTLAGFINDEEITDYFKCFEFIIVPARYFIVFYKIRAHAKLPGKAALRPVCCVMIFKNFCKISI